MNISQILRERAEENPNKTAIRDPKSRIGICFKDLLDRSEKLAELFTQNGIHPGDGVLLFVPMSLNLYLILTALFLIQAAGVFIDPSFTKEQIQSCSALFQCDTLIGSSAAHVLSLFSPSLRKIKTRFTTGSIPFPGAIPIQKAAHCKPFVQKEETADSAPALITFTSGSTGKPKGTVRTHGFLFSQHQATASTFKIPREDIVLTNLPIFLLSFLASGFTCVIPDADPRRPGEINPDPVIRQIALEKVSSILAPPAFLDRLVQRQKQKPFTFENITSIYTGGGPVLPRNLTELQNLAPKAEITAVYGSTEAEPIAHLEKKNISIEDQKKMGSGNGLLAGHPVEKIQIVILQDTWGKPIPNWSPQEFSERLLPPLKKGEIVVSGPHVLPGYLNGIGNEETKFRVGEAIWHRTGDAGCLDNSGRLWLLGRCAAKIWDGEKSIYPFEVEYAAWEFEEVRHAAFIFNEKKRILILEPYEGQSLPNLTTLQEKLKSAPVDEIKIVKKIPMDKRHNTKIDYTALQKQLRVMG